MSLSVTLLSDVRRPAVIADLGTVVDEEVSAKRGLSGAAIKTGYAAARKVSPGITDRALNRMLPDFAVALEPYWAQFQQTGGGDFGGYLADRGEEVANALLAITDARVAASTREPIKKVYQGLRGAAQENVKSALPRLGAAVQRQAS